MSLTVQDHQEDPGQDHQGILTLAGPYWQTVDAGDSHGFAETFTPEGIWVHAGADALAQVLPDAQRQTLPGQTHTVAPNVLAPAISRFFRD